MFSPVSKTRLLHSMINIYIYVHKCDDMIIVKFSQKHLFNILLSSQDCGIKISGWDKHVINDVYYSVGGTDVGLCHVGLAVDSNTIST